LKADFIHLHNHSEYSPIDSCCAISKFADYCRKMDMPAVALTDHGNMQGAILFYKACTADSDKDGNPIKPIKPIIGSEFYICPDRFDKEHGRKASRHLILMAENNKGYLNLMRLSELSYTEGFYYTPRIDFELLKEYHEGLICSSACIIGGIPRAIIDGDHKRAKEETAQYKDLFGDRFYLEVQNHGIEEQQVANKGIKKLSDEMGIPIIATNDVHYFEKKHSFSQEVLMAVNRKITISNPKHLSFGDTAEFYFKTLDEMKEKFDGWDDSIFHNTVEIAERCNVEIELGGMLLPEYDLPDGFNNDWDYLKHLAYEGMKRLGFDKDKEYIERLEEELYDVRMVNEVKGYNFARYFLMVWDYVNYAHEQGIITGCGRGSACGSLLLYCLDVTKIDPIKYDLVWWRFLTVDKRPAIKPEDFGL